jgi:hypothetical protein
MQQDLQPTPARWSFGKKLAFLFFMLFFPLYIFFNPNGVVPNTEAIFTFYIDPFHRIIPWIGKHILHLPYDITTFTNGSGDTTYDYVVILFIFVLSLVGAIIWAVLDRKRPGYNQLYHWLTVVVRYYAAITMFSYGFFKVFKLQFPAAEPWRLIQPYGESSPMGLAWTYMGQSTLYNYFTGGAELLGGILLLFRRTATLGALVTLGVMGNVMMINYGYDVPVKLLSTTVVVMMLFLLAKDMNRLYYFFIANKTAPPSDIARPVIRNKKLRYGLLIFKVLVIGYCIGVGGYDAASLLSSYGDNAPKSPLRGIYNVETYVRNNDTIPPLQSDSTRWKQLIVSGYRDNSFAMLRGMNDSALYHIWQLDTVKKSVIMYPWTDTAFKNNLAYVFPDKDHMEMRGSWRGDSLYVRFKIYHLDKFRLVNRGFHWINEYPFNR